VLYAYPYSRCDKFLYSCVRKASKRRGSNTELNTALRHIFYGYINFELLDTVDEATVLPGNLLAQWQSVTTLSSAATLCEHQTSHWKYFFYFLLAYLTLYKGVSQSFFSWKNIYATFLYPKKFLSIKKSTIQLKVTLKKNCPKKIRMQLVVHVDYSSIAKFQTKIPATFRGIFRIFVVLPNFHLFIPRFFAEPPTIFCGALVCKHWSAVWC